MIALPSASFIAHFSSPAALAPVASALADHLWQSTAFAVLAALLTVALRSNHARTRYRLWFAASIKFLVPLSLVVVAGSHVVAPRPTAAPAAGTYRVVEEVSQPFARAAAPTAIAPALNIAPAVASASPVRAHRGYALPANLVPALLLTLWLAGTLVVLARWAVRWWRISAVVRNAPALTSGREFDALRRIQRLAGLRRAIVLKQLPISVEPGIFGVVRPVLLWPQGISSRLSDAQMDAILAHEVCHVRRGDNLTSILHMAVEALFWFHPLVWWLETRLIAERENACDQEVLEFGGHPRAYAESILKVCEFCVESPLPCVAGVTGSDLRSRIASIVRARALARITWPKKLLLAAAALCILAVPVMLGQARAAQRVMLAAIQAAPRHLAIAAHAMLAQAPAAAAPDATPAAATGPAFASVNIRPTVINPQGQIYGIQLQPSGRMVFSSMTLKTLVMMAYSEPDKVQMVQGGPKWAESDQYDIATQLNKADVADWDKLDFPDRMQRVRPMLQTILAQRFNLKEHTATLPTPVYVLEQAKGGSKLKEVPAPTDEELKAARQPQPANSQPSDTPRIGIAVSQTGWTGHAVKVAELTGWLGYAVGMEGRPILDQTGLTAYYDFALSLIKQEGGPTAEQQMEEQLGLRLEARSVPIRTFVIDAADKPTIDPAGAAAAPVVAADTPPPPPHIHFDVVSWKRCADGAAKGSGRVDLPIDSDFVAYHCQPVRRIIYFAYAGPMPFELSGHPSWVDDDLYEFQAKVVPEDVAAWKAMTINDKRIAVRDVLADQLKLQIHVDQTPQPAYALTVAKGGRKLTEYKAGEQWKIPDGRVLQGRQQAFLGNVVYLQNFTMNSLAQNLSARLDRPVVDKTGLDGSYDVTLPFSKGTANASPSANSGDEGESVDSALAKLGLKLESTKTEADGLVVDHIERPAEN